MINQKVEEAIRCDICSYDLRLSIEINMENGQHKTAKKFLGKDKIETGEDLIKLYRYCPQCNHEFGIEEKQAIAKYSNEYIGKKQKNY